MRVKNARADLKEKVFQGDWEDPDDGSTTPGGSYDGYWDQINNLANRIADLVKKIWTDGWKNGQQLVQDLKALDEECGKLEDALENAYKGTMMQGKFPGAVLMLEMPADLVDVNVHPAKTEIRFAKESDVFDAVYRAVRTALATPGSGECRFEMGRTDHHAAHCPGGTCGQACRTAPPGTR